MTWPENVQLPLKINGLQIGSADLKSDGTLDLMIRSDSPLVRELFESVRLGLVASLSITPEMIPAVAGGSRLVDGFVMRGVSGLQFGHGNNQVNNY